MLRRMTQTLRGRWPRAKETMLHVLEETMNGRIPAPRASTYIEPLSAGKLGLIRNTRLRDALLAADPKLKVALNMYATSSANQLQVALMQQKKALAVSSILESGARRSGESR